MRTIKRSALLATPFVFIPVLLAGQATMKPEAHVVMTPDKLTWSPIQPPGFDAGAKIATLYGDPNATSGTYVIRLEFPDDYKFPAHWHPNAESLTVISGEFFLGMGDTVDDSKLVSYKPGTFLFIPAKNVHFGKVDGTTVIQLHGQAPFQIEVVTKKP
jgi:quercetin dioxygenase-like cupin family protein